MDTTVLETLEKTGVIEDSSELARQHGWEHNQLTGVLLRLQSHFLVELDVVPKETVELTPEGEQVLSDGSPEARLWSRIPEGGLAKRAAMELPFGKTGFADAMKNKEWIEYDKQSDKLIRKVPAISDTLQLRLREFKDGKDFEASKERDIFTRKKLIKTVKSKAFRIRKGVKFSIDGVKKKQLDITADVLASGAWKTDEFKEYNFEAQGQVTTGGHLHPLLKVRAAFREIFLEMGFEEMLTNSFVESSFWNFDALYQPQQHPTREAHDTFFLTRPKETQRWPQEYLEKVQEMHEKGGHGSIGYRYNWSIDEAKKNILRTHTTAVSTRMLYKLAQQKQFTPKKYFSIDRVYRNETLDHTHLAEFHQIEGLVADYNLTLADLIGVITQFFQKWGMTKLRFKPAFNPYTEPSMEIFGYHNRLQKWVEIGNSGMFRPEMLLPMGFDPNVRVIAWGLGLERPTMIRYDISNIRDLVGHRVSLDFIKANPLCDLQLEDAYDEKKFVREGHATEQATVTEISLD